jgi:hypothetical protein
VIDVLATGNDDPEMHSRCSSSKRFGDGCCPALALVTPRGLLAAGRAGSRFFGMIVRAYSRPMQGEPETRAALTKARSLLVILLATCHETLLALEAVANVLDTQLTSDLTAMIARSEDELRIITEKIEALA